MADVGVSFIVYRKIISNVDFGITLSDYSTICIDLS